MHDYMHDERERHARALKALGDVLMADDPSIWGRLHAVFNKWLTLTERVHITAAGLASLPDSVMADLRYHVIVPLPDNARPHPSFVLDRIGADRWAELADRQDQRLIMGAVWRRMEDRDRRAFLEFAGVCHDREVIHAV